MKNFIGAFALTIVAGLMTWQLILSMNETQRQYEKTFQECGGRWCEMEDRVR